MSLREMLFPLPYSQLSDSRSNGLVFVGGISFALLS